MSATPPGTRRKPARNRGGAHAPAGKPRRGAGAAQKVNLKNIVWIASFPKSGNTWARIFLANYLLNPEQPIPINQVHRIGTGDSVAIGYRIVAGGTYDPTDHIGHIRLRDRVLRAVAANGADMNFLKSHNARIHVQGVNLVPPKFTRAAIYILRNPLDVAVSYARHYGISTEETVHRLSRADNGIAADSHNVWQYLGNWSDHVESWVNARDIPVHAMRYEDMKATPHETFAAMLEFLGVPLDDERLDRAIRFSSFDEMQRQESKAPFVERSAHSKRFFHTGKTGQWEDAIAPEDIDSLCNTHREVMTKFGYL